MAAFEAIGERGWSIPRAVTLLAAVGLACGLIAAGRPAAAADAAFAAFIAKLRPDALAKGVSGATFDRETAGLEPDLSLPDLVKAEPPHQPKPAHRDQAEFTVAPQDYVSAKRIAQLAAEGRGLARTHAKALAEVETKVGVDGPIVLAIWGRETDYGKQRDRYDAIRVLATQAFTGRRRDTFRDELIVALKLIEDGRATRAQMKSSWAGAMGLTQFMPSEFYSSAVDLDGDGKIDLFGSVPDALGSAGQQLKLKGWVKGLAWGIEVVPGQKVDCANEGPLNQRPISDWAGLGVARADKKPFSRALMAAQAYLMSPGGANGPQFLVTENFKVLRAYNTSDLYALFVGHLADRIAGGHDFVTPWHQARQLDTAGIAEVQSTLKASGHKIDKLDGRIGSETRLRIGLYQRAHGLAVDCWPSAALLTAMRGSSRR